MKRSNASSSYLTKKARQCQPPVVAAGAALTAAQRAGYADLGELMQAAQVASITDQPFDMSAAAGHKPGYYSRHKLYQQDFIHVVQALAAAGHRLPYAASKYERLDNCYRQTWFVVGGASEKARLALAFGCGLPLCPTCEAARSHKRMIELSDALEALQRARAEAGKSPLVVLMLTETLPNCRGDQLGDYIDLLFRAHDKLMHYKAVKTVVLGTARSFEITHKRDDDYHPHLHTLLLVEQSYFEKRTAHCGYLSQKDWANLHYKAVKAACKSSPIAWSDIQQPEGQTFSVDVRRAYRKGAPADARLADAASSAGREATKYACKPDELMHYNSDGSLDMAWSMDAVLTVQRAIYGRRRYTSSGLWREALTACGYDAESAVDDPIGEVSSLPLEERKPDASGVAYLVMQQEFLPASVVQKADYYVRRVSAAGFADDDSPFFGTPLGDMIDYNIAQREARKARVAAAAQRLADDWTSADIADGWTSDLLPDPAGGDVSGADPGDSCSDLLPDLEQMHL